MRFTIKLIIIIIFVKTFFKILVYCGYHALVLLLFEYLTMVGMKKVLKVCGQQIKVLSFPNIRAPLTLEEMLQYCSNVQHLSLPLPKLDYEQL